MAILEILKHPDPRLKEKAVPVKEITQEIQVVIDDMIETMYADGGMGLAAIQVGVAQRIFVMDDSKDQTHPQVFINPEVIEKKGEIELQEGCLSFPGVFIKIKRPEFVKITAKDREGNDFEISGDDYVARCFLHEIDHLDGVTFFDYLSPLKRQMAEKKLKKHMRQIL